MSAQFRPYVVRRYVAAVYERIAIPPAYDSEEKMIFFARGAMLGRYRCALVLGTEQVIWFDEKGAIVLREESGAKVPKARPDVGRMIG